MLLALTSASRASSIHHLHIRFMFLSEEKVVFNFAKLQKLGKRVEDFQNLKFLHLKKTRIFVYSNFKSVSEYVTRMERWKKDTIIIKIDKGCHVFIRNRRIFV